MVLANVPSFRFSFRGNIRRNHPFGNHPFVNTKKGHWEIKGRFPKGWFWRTYPRSGFRSGGTSAKTTLLETTLLRTPEFCDSMIHRADLKRSEGREIQWGGWILRGWISFLGRPDLQSRGKPTRKIPFGFLTRATGKKAKVRANFRKSSCERGVFLVFLDFGWFLWPLPSTFLKGSWDLWTAPRSSVQKSPNTYSKGFWDLWTENWGPNTRTQTTMDPTPHSRPSETLL